MNYKSSIIKFLFLGLLSVSCSNLQKQEFLVPDQGLITTRNNSSFFCSIPIQKYSSIGAPCINVKIEEKVHLMQLDLGFSGAAALREPFFSLIESKKFTHTASVYDFQGHEYAEDVYVVPEIKIGLFTFSDCSLRKENEEFIKNTVFSKDEALPNDEKEDFDSGSIGFPLFQSSNLLIDLKNFSIGFCDSMNKLGENGYRVENFQKAPLLLDRGLIECEANIFNQSMRCLLDTGSTWNVINTALQDGQSLEDAVWETKSIKFSSILIGTQTFDSMPFRAIPINMPIHIEAVLGIPFFSDHVVFIDFIGKNIYFARADAATF